MPLIDADLLIIIQGIKVKDSYFSTITGDSKAIPELVLCPTKFKVTFSKD